MKSTTVCFTGHRIIPSGEKEVISKMLEDILTLLVNKGYKNFVAGGALGFDTLAAEKVLKLRKIYPNVRLILALPCLSQTNGWRFLDKMKYEAIKNKADEVFYTSEKYDRGCMFKRNRYMVDRSSVCICYLTKETGGTAYTVKYAKQKNLEIISLCGN